MDRSDSIKNLAVALNKAQSEMGGAHKGADNPFFKTKYADLSSVVQAVKSPFSNNGLSYTQFPIESNGRIGVETILMHESGEYISNEFTVNLTKQDAQGAGSAITYCRRYALQAIAGIPSEDDDGNAASPQGDHNSQPQNQNDDGKEWYKDHLFEQHTQYMREQLSAGVSPEDLIKEMRQTYKVANKYLDMIKGL
jgi:hypothetical protein